MPVVNIERVLSANSEDTAHPVENLLNPDNSKRWKCKAGEKQASAILQLKEQVVIEAIDIGNENSAFVEILVGKSSSQHNDFKVLLVTSSLMTLKEAKDGTNTSGVRFFKSTDLSKPTANEKWDRIKIVCTQPFNKHVQYGLAFVVLHSPDGSGESSGTLGKFALKEADNELPVAVGSWFAKRKDPPPPIPPGAAAAIRDASSPAGIAQGKNRKPAPKMPKKKNQKNGVMKPSVEEEVKPSPKADPPKLSKPANNLNMSFEEDDSPADDTDADSNYSPNKDIGSVLSDDDDISAESGEEERRKEKRPKRNKEVDNGKKTKNGNVMNGQTPKRKNSNTDENKKKAIKVDRETKPFGRLLEGVTVVISGYQNPLRGQLRSKACAMGAKYKADWDSTSTHLICAFVNTPKFNQVRGRGKIVKKEWIEECHNRRRRLPWRRFALDRNDAGTSSEEEIWEENSVPSTSSVNTTIVSGINRRNVSSGSDTEEEIERVRARQTADKPVTPAPSEQKVKESKRTARVTLEKRVDKADPFDDDTDVDSESESQTSKLSLPPLPDFFENIVFHIASDIDDDERRKLQRYITAYKGCVLDEIDGNVEYTITKQPDIAAELAEEFGISALTPDWVWTCSDAEKLVPVSDYLL
uniref:BRCT domain-containing protein n=1 Tax=Graphocephala atropunctata TaxID=36148 RepID=A0A1B6KXU3_9HEMI